jgi:hypothetical protein
MRPNSEFTPAGVKHEQRQEHIVSSVDELLAAVRRDTQVKSITVVEGLLDAPSLRLSRGQALQCGEETPTVRFRSGQDGLQLSTDNLVGGLRLVCDSDRRAVFNDTLVPHLGRIELRDLQVTGVVQILARDRVTGGHIDVHQVHIEAADAREFDTRPQGYCVQVIPGAFTVWNQQSDKAVVISEDIGALEIGRAEAAGGGFDKI